MNILSFASSRFPERRQRDAPGRQADRCHGTELEAARHDRILSVESQFASAVRRCQTDIRQQPIHSTVEVEPG
jgi:hypothetical protein